MRKLKLQMQITVDGHVAGPQGQLDWMTFDMDERLLGFINEMIDTSDTILLGRKMTTGFVNYWEDIVSKPQSPEYAFGQKMVSTAKVVFSKTVDQMNGKNIHVETGDLVEAVNRLKSQTGTDLIVYGGATFVSSLVDHGLIDELNLFVNPVAIADGMRIFHQRRPLALTRSTVYPCGIVVNTYQPK
jgi:dihydrofolate reductase